MKGGLWCSYSTPVSSSAAEVEQCVQSRGGDFWRDMHPVEWWWCICGVTHGSHLPRWRLDPPLLTFFPLASPSLTMSRTGSKKKAAASGTGSGGRTAPSGKASSSGATSSSSSTASTSAKRRSSASTTAGSRRGQRSSTAPLAKKQQPRSKGRDEDARSQVDLRWQSLTTAQRQQQQQQQRKVCTAWAMAGLGHLVA